MVRFIPILIVAVLLAGVFAPLFVSGGSEQIPPGQPLEREP
jgi:hypothetical protein